jgi:hypothetical protein
MPGLDLVGKALLHEVRNFRRLVHRDTNTVADHIADEAEAVGFARAAESHEICR